MAILSKTGLRRERRDGAGVLLRRRLLTHPASHNKLLQQPSWLADSMQFLWHILIPLFLLKPPLCRSSVLVREWTRGPLEVAFTAAGERGREKERESWWNKHMDPLEQGKVRLFSLSLSLSGFFSLVCPITH